MIRRPPRSTRKESSAASDVYKRQILGFILMAALVTWVPTLAPTGKVISSLAKIFLVVTLFLIGSGLSLKSLKEVGTRPLALGLSLWIIVASTTLYFIKINIIH